MRLTKFLSDPRPWLRRANTGTAAVLVPAIAGILGLLVACQILESAGGRESAGGQGYLVPQWLFNILLVVVTTGLSVIFAFRVSRQWPTEANLTVTFGMLTTVILTWVTQQCNATSGVVAGIAIGGLVIIAIAVARALTGGLKSAANQLIAETQSVPWSMRGLLAALRIAVAIFMGFMVWAAFTDDLVSSDTRPLVLVFAGAGITAVASISSKISFKNLMAFVGMVILLVGSYMQIDQAVDSASSIIVAAAILAFIMFMSIAFRTNRIVPILTVPIAATFTVMYLAILITAIPTIFIASGCGVSEVWLTKTVYLSVIVSIAFGGATGVVVAVLLIRDSVGNSSRSSRR